jgi:hypothetical protein
MAMSITMAIIIATFLVTALGVLLIANLSLGNKPVDRRIETLYTVADPQFLRSMGSLLGPAIIEGNRTQALVNGNEIFPAMLKAIRGAQKTITFETFIYWSGAIGQEFAEALTERARAGVHVHVMLDWLGSGDIDEAYVQQMEEAGVEVLRYNPLRWYTITRMNPGRIANSWWSTVKSASPAVLESPSRGPEMRRIHSIGGIRIFALKVLWSRRCNRRSSTTGSKSADTYYTAPHIFLRLNRPARTARRSSRVRPAAAAKARS